MQGALQKCLDRIHLRYKAVLCLGALEELNHQEIAQRLGLSVAAVKTRIHRARRILRPMLEQELVARRERRNLAPQPNPTEGRKEGRNGQGILTKTRSLDDAGAVIDGNCG